MGIRYNTSIVRNGLVLHLDAANVKSYPGSGTTWTDLSGNGNHGTLVNGPTFDSANKGIIVFDGVNDSYSVSGFNCNKTYYSIEWWLCPVLNKDWNHNIMLNNGWGDFTWHTGANSQFWAGTDLSTRFSNVNAGSVTLNTWQQWVFTFDNGSAKIYKNSVLLQSKTGMAVSTRANFTSISCSSNGNGVNGRLSTIRLYSNKVLSQTEIKQNFEATRGRYSI